MINETSEFYRHGKQLSAPVLDARLSTVCEWKDMAQVGA